ncbi:stress transcription factor A [Seminavis robusta]|uniref:Stress transcription factor A n=1 Tax=Seminavis robusta TaxID=568900 RepID=A0A9N8EUT2_9STRA|nr:stress transcription factor A [Seminavis robusta]|eukprot:Sro1884_g303510.1 stress transcription factor A (501) ;mRNA; f:14765-16434
MMDDQAEKKAELLPYPFFHYRDFSTETDPDPLTPLTFAGRMPNFPAKVHAILSRSDLTDIISWLPHGRSFLVLKPREFESKVLPVYFKHSKITSFIRQANGWGFRRVMQGPDRNSYYHPRFLRGLPHLCKQMKRPAKSQKELLETGDEPDFYKISEMYPVPERIDQETMLLQSTLQDGPQARMPIISGSTAVQIPNIQDKPAARSEESGKQEMHSALGVLASVSTENLAEALHRDSLEAGLLHESPAPANADVAYPPSGTLPTAVSTGSFHQVLGVEPSLHSSAGSSPASSVVHVQLQPLVPTAPVLASERPAQEHWNTAASHANMHASNSWGGGRTLVALAPNPIPVGAYPPVAIGSPRTSPILAGLPAPPANIGMPQQANAVAVPQVTAAPTPQASANGLPPVNAVTVVPQAAPQANAPAMPNTMVMPQMPFVPQTSFPGMDASSAAQFAAGFAMAAAFGQQQMQTMMQQAGKGGGMAIMVPVGQQPIQHHAAPAPLP